MLPGQPVDHTAPARVTTAAGGPGGQPPSPPPAPAPGNQQPPAAAAALAPTASSYAPIATARPPGLLESPPPQQLQRASASIQHGSGTGGGGSSSSSRGGGTPLAATPVAISVTRLRSNADGGIPGSVSLGSPHPSESKRVAASSPVDALILAERSLPSLSTLPTQLLVPGGGAGGRSVRPASTAAAAGGTTGNGLPMSAAHESLLDVEASALARQLGVGNDDGDEGDDGLEVEEEPLEPHRGGSGFIGAGTGGVTDAERAAASNARGSRRAFGSIGAVGYETDPSGLRRGAFGADTAPSSDPVTPLRPGSPAGAAATTVVATTAAAASGTAAVSRQPAPAAAAPAPGPGGPTESLPAPGPRRRPPPGTPRQPRPDEVGRTEYFSACPTKGLEYQTILRVHRRAILCGAVRKCSRAGTAASPSVRGGTAFMGGAAGGAASAGGGGGYRGPSWLLLSGGEDGYVLWDLTRGRPLLMSLEEEGRGAGPGAAGSGGGAPAAGAAAGPGPGSGSGGSGGGAQPPEVVEGDVDRPSGGRAQPSGRRQATNITALKQMLSFRRRADSDEEDSDDDHGGREKEADDGGMFARTTAASGGSGGGGVGVGGGGGAEGFRGSGSGVTPTLRSPLVGGRPRHPVRGSTSPLRGSSYTGCGGDSDSDSEERAAAAWQAASYRNMITAVAFISDTKWATCHPKGTIRVWAADASYTSATLQHTLHGHTGYINNIASYGGGRFAITTGLDTTARSWDLAEGRELTCFRDHENEVTAVAVMESGRMALTTAEVVPEVASAMLWDPSSGKLLHTLYGHHGWLFGVALSERRKIAVAIGEHATLFIWNTETGELLLAKVVASDGLQRWCSINSDGNFLCFGSAEGVVRVVETFYGCELARFDSTWVDPDFHSISACFFCDDELHDAPEHWNDKFLSLEGDNSDISRLFQPHGAIEGSGRALSSQTKGGTAAAAAAALSTLGGALGGFIPAQAAAGAGGPGGPGGAAAGANKNVVRARMLHSVRAAAALAAIGRAAAAGHTNNDPDEDLELLDSQADLSLQDGKLVAAAKAFSVTANANSTSTCSAAPFGPGPGRPGGGTGDGTGGEGDPPGRRSVGGSGALSNGRRSVMGARRVAPLPAQLERISTANARHIGQAAAAAQASLQNPPAPADRTASGKPSPPAPAAAATTTTTTTTTTSVIPAAAVAESTHPTGAPNKAHLRFALPDDSDKDKQDRDLDGGGGGGGGEDAADGKADPAGYVPESLPSLKPGSTSRVFLKGRTSSVVAPPAAGFAGERRSSALGLEGAGGGISAAGGASSVSRRRVSIVTAGAGAGGGAVSRPVSAAPGSRLSSLAGLSASSMTSGGGGGSGGVSRSGPSGHLQEILGHRNPTELEISPFGRRIVSLSGDGTVRVWSLLGVSVRRELPRHPEMVNEIAISRDRSLVATVTENEGCLRLFSMATGHPVATVAAHVGFDCDGVALSDDARLVSHDPFAGTCRLQGTAVTCSDDTTIRIWDLSSPGEPECVRTLYGHAGGVTGVCWVPGSSRVLSVGEDRSVLEWDAGPGGGSRPVARMDHVHEDAISAVVVSPDATRALTCSMDRTARLWELSPAHHHHHHHHGGGGGGGGGGGPHHPHHHHRPSALAYSAAAAAAASEAHQLSSTSPHMPSRPEVHRFLHDNSVTHGAFSPDGRHVVTCGADCTVRLWDTDNGKQLACFEGHTRTVTRCVYLNNFVVATTSRDGTIRCWDVARKRRLPTLAPPFALENDSFEAMVLLPSQRTGYGFPEVLASLTSGRVVVYDPTYRQPLPEQLLLQLNPELELLGPADVEDLVVDFPGLLVMPIRDGNTMLHMVAMSGDYVLLRALLSGVSGGDRHGSVAAGSRYGNAPPLPLNFAGQTPLDLAVAAGHRRCAELLLGTELTRPPEQRLAVLRAWHSLAVEMPSLLVSFLKALSLDPAAGMEEDVLFAPLRANDEVMTLGSEDLAAADLWLDQITQLREDLDHLPWYAKAWPLRHLWDYREKPTSPSVAGLPYVAMAARNMEHSPLGVLVQHGLSQALASDVMYAVLFYKWESFARAIFLRESLVFIAFLAVYLVASTMSVLKSPHVTFRELYDMHQPACVIRMVLEVVLALMALHDIYGEITEVVNAGWYMYLAGSQGSWNGLEVSSCIGLLLTFGLQLGSFEGGSRFAMSLTTILLGLRLLKVASGPEHTGVFVQALLRIVANLRFFMLILIVLVLTFSIAFWQIMSFDLAPGETSRMGKDFDTLGNSIVTAYAYGVIGQMNPDVATGFQWRPWMQVLMLTYTFLVTVILLNLLVAVMSDTYSVVKEHARSEWLLLRAKLILEIESSLPDAFFKDTTRSCPRWLHCLKVDTTGGRRGDETLIESLRGPVARHVLNTDLNKTETRLVEELHEVRDALRLLHADVGNMRTAVAGIGDLAATAAAAATGNNNNNNNNSNNPNGGVGHTGYYGSTSGRYGGLQGGHNSYRSLGINPPPFGGGSGGGFGGGGGGGGGVAYGSSLGGQSRASSWGQQQPSPLPNGAGGRGSGPGTRPASALGGGGVSGASGAHPRQQAPVSAGRRREC